MDSANEREVLKKIEKIVSEDFSKAIEAEFQSIKHEISKVANSSAETELLRAGVEVLVNRSAALTVLLSRVVDLVDQLMDGDTVG